MVTRCSGKSFCDRPRFFSVCHSGNRWRKKLAKSARVIEKRARPMTDTADKFQIASLNLANGHNSKMRESIGSPAARIKRPSPWSVSAGPCHPPPALRSTPSSTTFRQPPRGLHRPRAHRVHFSRATGLPMASTSPNPRRQMRLLIHGFATGTWAMFQHGSRATFIPPRVASPAKVALPR